MNAPIWGYVFVIIVFVIGCLVVVKYSGKSEKTETSSYPAWTATQPSEPATEQVAEAESEEEADVVQEEEVVPEAAVASEEPELIEPAPQVSQSDYVDLGLPSGTRWKESNERGGDYEDGLYTYDDAVDRFGGSLPTHAQMTELFTNCQWAWNGSGYDVTGPNGRTIRLPLTGYRESNGTPQNRGITGNYWTREVREAAKYKAWKLYFRSDHKEICSWPRTDYHAVRLVE